MFVETEEIFAFLMEDPGCLLVQRGFDIGKVLDDSYSIRLEELKQIILHDYQPNESFSEKLKEFFYNHIAHLLYQIGKGMVNGVNDLET